MKTLTTTSTTFAHDLASFCSAAAPSPEIAATVAAILADIRARGDAALAHYAAKFDHAKLRPSDFRIPPDDLAAAARALPSPERRAIKTAHASILAHNRRNLPKNWLAKNKHGAQTGEKFDPIRRVGLYIPGGQAPLVSTVLHTATLAQIAACPQIAAFTPSDAAGRVAPALLAALHIVGIDEVYRIGGVQAIGAMACGTATIPPVDKIFGPGNAYVCEAKRQVFGLVGVDSLPGPSELMVIADETANPAYIAADLLAQAEHGSGREKIYLIAPTKKIIAAISAEIALQLKTLPRQEKIQQVLTHGYLAIEAPASAPASAAAALGNAGVPPADEGRPDPRPAIGRSAGRTPSAGGTPALPANTSAANAAPSTPSAFSPSGFQAFSSAAAAIANYVAPEHLEIITAPAAEKKLLRDITTAGAIFLGNHTPTALGDFTAGPSHVLPTARTARFSSGLRVADFMRRTSLVRYTPATIKKAAEVTTAFSAMENLDAHGRSVKIRAT